MPEPILHLFTSTGTTFTFRGVTIETVNETTLVFTYKAMSDSRTKRAVVYVRSLVAWSTTVD